MRLSLARARRGLAVAAAVSLVPILVHAASHREAPVTSLDRTADITDFYAFRSPDQGTTLTAIMCTDPLLEPANGPNYFPFDPGVVYQINVDNNHDARADLTFEFRFKTEIRAPTVPVGFIGVGSGGIPPLVPPAITALDGAGAAGLSLRQTYTATLLRPGLSPSPLTRPAGAKLFAVPSNVGERTMPNYKNDLYEAGDFDVKTSLGTALKVFAGTVDDAFFIDLGAAFDSLNFRTPLDANPGDANTPSPAVLLADQDADDHTNFNPDDVSGYNVNCIAVQAPMSLLTFDLKWPTQKNKQIGLWATTSRAKQSVRTAGVDDANTGSLVQIQRMANPLVNELLIGTGSKNKWSGAQPKDDSQFTSQLLDPLIIKVVGAAFGLPVPPAPRNDLGALLFYTEAPAGPAADLLRVNLEQLPTTGAAVKRLGGCAGDPGGFPNGRRLADDVTDCFLRVGMGLLIANDPRFGAAVPALGDGVNTNDFDLEPDFPYLAPAQSGRSARHVDPGEPGCGATFTQPCPEN